MTPGVHTAMRAAEYHRLPHLSNSLSQILIGQSALHAWTASPALNPNYQRVEKEEFDIGQATHALLLEGQDRMAVIEADDWRTKAAREARDEARAAGKHPILARRYQDVLKMRDVAVRALAECEDLGGLTLANGQAELVLTWIDEGDVACRARLDFLSNVLPSGGRIVLDYKSTTDATPRAFSRQIARMGYHLQDEFYSRGVERVLGRRPRFVFMAQETAAPYACSFHGCAPSLRAIARAEVEYAIGVWRDCVRTNRWPAHDQRIHWAEAAAWQITEVEERIGIPYDYEKLFGDTMKRGSALETDPAV